MKLPRWVWLDVLQEGPQRTSLVKGHHSPEHRKFKLAKNISAPPNLVRFSESANLFLEIGNRFDKVSKR